jgi:hypothetical protein
VKFKTIFSFEKDMRRFKEEMNPATRWEKLKEYAVKNDVPVPIGRRGERKIMPGESATASTDHYYDSKFFELEALVASYVDRRRMLCVAISTFLLTRFFDWLPVAWHWLSHTFYGRLSGHI